MTVESLWMLNFRVGWVGHVVFKGDQVSDHIVPGRVHVWLYMQESRSVWYL